MTARVEDRESAPDALAGSYLANWHAHGLRGAAAFSPASPRAWSDRDLLPTRPAISPWKAGVRDAVRGLVVLADQLVHEDPQRLPRCSTPFTVRLARVARLRDELHVTANRVCRFRDDAHPVVDPIRITAPISGSRAPAQLIFQLDLTAGRLVAHVDALSDDGWTRSGKVGGEFVTLGEVVERVLQRSTHDLLALVDDATVCVSASGMPDAHLGQHALGAPDDPPV